MFKEEFDMVIQKELDTVFAGKPDIKIAKKINTVESKKWMDICSDRFPSDEVLIDGKVLDFFQKFLYSSGFDFESHSIPDDLILDNNVPMPNIVLKDPDADMEHTYRFVLDGQDLYLVDTLDPKMLYQTLKQYPHAKKFSVVSKFKHENHLFVPDLEEIYVTHERMDPNNVNLSIRRALMEFYKSSYWFSSIMLESWYAIQLLLLHPDCTKNDILKRERKVKVHNSNLLLKETKKRKTFYIKQSRVKIDSLDKQGFTRRTMCWYVIGHYRHYKNKTIWVKGYWKGPLRKSKKNLDEGRERIVTKDI